MSISRRAMPVTSMSEPAAMKNGIASRTKLLIPYWKAAGIATKGASPVMMKYSAPPEARMKGIGVPATNAKARNTMMGRNGSNSTAPE
ncbi:hypothetical protein D3C87_2045680 [compost metagenome]